MKKSDLINLLGKVTQEEEVITNPHERVLLIDGLNLFFRNFAMMKMVNQDGAHIGGLGGFLRSLNYLVNQLQPTSVYVVFDGAGSSMNRKNLLPEYKSNRSIGIMNKAIFKNKNSIFHSRIQKSFWIIHLQKEIFMWHIPFIKSINTILGILRDDKIFIFFIFWHLREFFT